MGKRVLAEISEFHGLEHITTLLLLLIKSWVRYIIILITMMINKAILKSTVSGTGRCLEAGKANPYPGYVTCYTKGSLLPDSKLVLVAR